MKNPVISPFLEGTTEMLKILLLRCLGDQQLDDVEEQDEERDNDEPAFNSM